MSPESPRFSIEVSTHAEREISKLPHAIARLILEEIRTRLSTDPIRETKTRIKGRRLSNLLSDCAPVRRDPRHLP